MTPVCFAEGTFCPLYSKAAKFATANPPAVLSTGCLELPEPRNKSHHAPICATRSILNTCKQWDTKPARTSIDQKGQDQKKKTRTGEKNLGSDPPSSSVIIQQRHRRKPFFTKKSLYLATFPMNREPLEAAGNGDSRGPLKNSLGPAQPLVLS